MAWTSPSSAPWTLGHLMSPSDMQTYISDNMDWLKSRPMVSLDLVGGQTTTSTSFGEMASSTVSLTTTGGNVSILLTGAAYNSGLFAVIFDLAIDDVRQGDSVNGLTGNSTAFANSRHNIGCEYMTDTPPLAGSHQYSVYWLVGGGTGTLQAGHLFVLESH